MADGIRLPRYQAIAESIRADIRRGVYHRAGTLPPMAALAEKYDVSRLTIRDALGILETDRLVETRQGVGTRLTERALGRESEPFDAEENFTSWKKLVKLPDDFPSLKPLKWKELDTKKKLYLRPLQETREGKIFRTAAGSARPRVSVIVNRGHGCTTLFNHIYLRLKTHLVVPVRVTWKRLGTDPDEFSENLDLIIREDVMRELTNPHWADMVEEVAYARLLGAVGGEGEAPDLHQHRDELRRWLSEPEPPITPSPPTSLPKEFRKLAPLIARGPLPELLLELRRAHIKTLLMVDLSTGDLPDPLADPPLDDLIGAIKDLLEKLPGHEDQGSLLSEMYFGTEQVHDQMTGLFSRSHHKIEFPAHTQADVFGILTRHYPAFVELKTTRDEVMNYSKNDLAAVVPSRLLGLAEEELSMQSAGFADIGLDDIISLLRAKILEALDRPWSQVTYHLDS